MSMTVEQVARDLASRMGLPADMATVEAREDRRGPYLLVLIAAAYIGRLAPLPMNYRGYRVAIEERGKKAA